MEDKEVVLSVRDLNVKFTLRGQILHAIRGISLDVYHGESLAIVGESGSGKSVFVKCAMGLLDANGYIDGGSDVEVESWKGFGTTVRLILDRRRWSRGKSE